MVDFDHSLGTAVNKIREALGDSAENPRYIETLAKRGYRFIAPVVPLDSPAATGTAVSSETVILPRVEDSRTHQTGSWGKTKPWLILASVGALVVVMGLGTHLWESSESSMPRLLPFTQVTAADSIFPGDVGVERFPALLTDGSRLYFSEIETGNVTLAYSVISGGDAHPLATPPEIGAPQLADISPDGSKLLVFGEMLLQLERTMWIVRSAGGEARKIVSGLGHDGTWMPDGSTILYASGNNILTTHSNGGEARV